MTKQGVTEKEQRKFVKPIGVSPKVSVIVPVYKVEKYLPECIDSILAQTFTDFELILVDDGSPDNSGKICDDYATRDSRIRVFHKENGGVSSARNFGIDNARGEWIALMDGDDSWLPRHLENIFRATVEFPDVKVFYTGYTNSRTNDFTPIDDRFAFEVCDYWAFALRGKAIWTSCVCFHSTITKEMPMFRTDLTHGEDLDVWRRMVRNRRVVMVPAVSAVYRIGSVNSAVASLSLPSKTIIWNMRLREIVAEDERKYFVRVYYSFLASYIRRAPVSFFSLLFRQRCFSFFGFCLFYVQANKHRFGRLKKFFIIS